MSKLRLNKYFLIYSTNEFPLIPSIYGDNKPRKTITELKCLKCGAIQNRDFQVGDYVFKEVKEEKCSKCGKYSLFINSIHDIIVPKKELKR